MLLDKRQKLFCALSALAAKLDAKLQTVPPTLTLAVAACIAILFFTFRDHGVYATVMWDEWEYNRYVRQLPFSLSDIPYYLYYFTYGITRFCGDSFLGCAQFMNAVFLAATMPFIYAVGRRTASQNLSLFVSITSVIGGISVYATHFVPEPMYFFGFWLGLWALLKYMDSKTDLILIALGVGCGLAILSLVKLHAQFLMPGIALYFIVCGTTRITDGGARKSLIAIIFLIVAFISVRMALGYILAGTAGLNIFGTGYTGNVHSAVASGYSVLTLLKAALPLLFDHIMVLAALYAVPFLIIATTKSDATLTASAQKILSLQTLAICLLLPLLIVVACYSAQVRAIHPEIEGGDFPRLHLRYYSFLFPLFAISAASVLTHPSLQTNRSAKKYIFAAFALILITAFAFCLPHFQLSVFDGPELRGFATIAVIQYILLLCAILSIVIWTWKTQYGALYFLLIFLPLITFMSTAAAFYSARLEKTPNIYQQAGLFAKTELGDNLSKLEIISPDYAGVYQAMFIADNPNIAYKYQVLEGSCLTLTPTPDGKEWFLLIGNYQIRFTYDQIITKDGYRLVHSLNPSNLEVQSCSSKL